MTGDDSPRRSRRIYLGAALVLVALAIAAVVYAGRTDPSRLTGDAASGELPVGKSAPALTGAKGWVNSSPLGPVELAGKVVVYDFWTYSCVNCVRTIPYLRSWFDRYASDGLVVVGVHSPEFDFEKVHANVESAVRRLGVSWPVAFDDDKTIWDRFANNYWPAKYVADRDGHIRFTHFGEGDYTGTEDVLRRLLGVDPGSPRAVSPNEAAPETSKAITGETYLGSDRGETGASQGPGTYPDVGSLPPGKARLVGDWTVAPEMVTPGSPGATIVLGYRAREVNLVLAPPPAGPVDVVVTLDGHPLAPDERTSQTTVEPDGTTVVKVEASDLYRLVLSPAVGEHTLRLTARSPGVGAFAFTFGG